MKRAFPIETVPLMVWVAFVGDNGIAVLRRLPVSRKRSESGAFEAETLSLRSSKGRVHSDAIADDNVPGALAPSTVICDNINLQLLHHPRTLQPHSPNLHRDKRRNIQPWPETSDCCYWLPLNVLLTHPSYTQQETRSSAAKRGMDKSLTRV